MKRAKGVLCTWLRTHGTSRKVRNLSSVMAATSTVTLGLSAVFTDRPSSRVPFYRPELDVVRFFAFLSVFAYHTLYSPLGHFVGRHVPMWFAQLQVSISRAGAYGVD